MRDYDLWLEDPYQEQCDWEYKVERKMDEYSNEKEFIEDARKWAIKKGLDPDAVEFLEDEYLESEECWKVCEERLLRW